MCRPIIETTESPLTKKSCGSKQLHQQHHQQHRQPPPVYFRWGKLRFGFHGIWACMTVVLTVTAFCGAAYNSGNDNVVMILSTIIANQILALDATSLLDQVPQSTVISTKPIWIVAPHKEAFQRTIAVMQYTNLRLSRQLLGLNWLRLPVYAAMSLYCWSLFWPFQADFRNGNTYFFVLPMFGGVTLDLIMQCWLSGDYLTTHYLLGIQLSALLVAFSFTLAFRGLVSIRRLYFGSAAVLVCLLVGVVYHLWITTNATTISML